MHQRSNLVPGGNRHAIDRGDAVTFGQYAPGRGVRCDAADHRRCFQVPRCQPDCLDRAALVEVRRQSAQFEAAGPVLTAGVADLHLDVGVVQRRRQQRQLYLAPGWGGAFADREHGVAWCKGVDPLTLLGLFRGASNGGWDPQEKRFNLYTIVIGSQTLHATGYAMGVVKDGAVGNDDGEAVIAYFGDGASSQGDVNEAFVWASVYNAPVVFFCQNNQWGISTPSSNQSRIPLYKRAEGFGFPGVRVDGNDVLASYAVTRQALDDARTGQGPTLVEAFTYRMGAHTTSDDPTRYRLASDLEAWKLKDPLERMKSFLYKQQLVDSAFFEQLESDADELAARIRKGCLEMPDPDPLSIFEDVYDEITPLLEEQRAGFAAYMEGFIEQGTAGGEH
ncbi:MAG: pyruvate dehydrogenase (acetyl-transferring) E1 component subunit alpha [Proteobacteria bacterium]|nr:pyruvate dehydrogenase (acetyl-transferring) E1 component subunit alpha [Pseudomonadota bacterium]